MPYRKTLKTKFGVRNGVKPCNYFSGVSACLVPETLEFAHSAHLEHFVHVFKFNWPSFPIKLLNDAPSYSEIYKFV
jgi:hypothetical protein